MTRFLRSAGSDNRIKIKVQIGRKRPEPEKPVTVDELWGRYWKMPMTPEWSEQRAALSSQIRAMT